MPTPPRAVILRSLLALSLVVVALALGSLPLKRRWTHYRREAERQAGLREQDLKKVAQLARYQNALHEEIRAAHDELAELQGEAASDGGDRNCLQVDRAVRRRALEAEEARVSRVLTARREAEPRAASSAEDPRIAVLNDYLGDLRDELHSESADDAGSRGGQPRSQPPRAQMLRERLRLLEVAAARLSWKLARARRDATEHDRLAREFLKRW